MGRRLYHFLLEQIQIIENDNRVSGEVPKRQGAYDAYRMVRMELETNYQRNHPAVQKILLFVLLLAIAGTVLFSFKWKAGKADRQSEADQMVDREYVEEYYANIFPDEMTENILKMLDLMNTDQKTELLKMGEPIADGIYVLGNEEQVRLGISAIVMENKTVAEDRERDVPSCEVKVLSDPNGYAFEVQAQEEEKTALARFQWCCYADNPIVPADSTLSLFYTTLSDGNLSEAHTGYFQSQAEEAKAMLHVERSHFFPEISVGYTRQDILPLKNLNAWMVGVSFPVYFLPQKSKVKQARLAAASAQIQADANIRELRNKVMELEASLRRYNESLRYYTTSALKEAEELTKAANLQLQQSETGVAEYIQSVTTARDIRRGYIETVYQYNIAALEHELFE